MKRILIAGAGGGIGSALVDRLASRPEVERIYAVHRRPVSSTCKRVVWLTADLCEAGEVDQLVQVARQEGGIDTLIIASGLLHDETLSPEKSLLEINPEHLSRIHQINAIAPLTLIAACRDLFRDSCRPRICVLSAQVGSIGDNRLGGWYAYRMAKAALNMAMRTAAIELSRLRNPPMLVCVHPGTTRTGLSSRFLRRRSRPAADTDTTAARLLALLDSLSPDQSGTFLNYDGVPIPW